MSSLNIQQSRPMKQVEILIVVGMESQQPKQCKEILEPVSVLAFSRKKITQILSFFGNDQIGAHFPTNLGYKSQ